MIIDMLNDKLVYYLIHKLYGTSSIFHAWTRNYSFIQEILRNSNNSFEIKILELNPSTADVDFMDYMYDTYQIAPSDLDYYKIKIMNTKSEHQILSCENEFERILFETDCIYDTINKMIVTIESLMILSPYVYEKLSLFISYIKMKYMDEIVKEYGEGEIDIHNSNIDIIYIMMTEGLLLEV